MNLTTREQNLLADLLLAFVCDFADDEDVEHAFDPEIGLVHPTPSGYVRAMLAPVSVAAVIADLARMTGATPPDMVRHALGEG